MLRKIAKSVEEKALQLWLEGHAYRSISDRLRISLGAISRIVDDTRKRVPDLDELKRLSVMLKRDESSVHDAIRGAKLLDKLNEHGVDLDKLDSYIELSGRISSERGVEAAELVEASLRLVEIQSKTGKPAHEIAREFEEKSSKVKELNRRLEALRRELQDAERQREISQLCEQLKAIGVEPSRLKDFLQRRGSFERQLQAIEEKMKNGEARLKMLTKMEGDFRRSVDDVKRVDSLLHQRFQSFVCAYCGFATPHEVRRFEVQSAMTMGRALFIACVRCGATNTYDPRIILTNLGLGVLS